MSRTRSSAKAAGAKFERDIANHFAAELANPNIDRLVRRGNKDVGDVGWVLTHGQRIVIECKDTARTDLPAWTREAAIEAGNADALCGVVIAKRHGVGAPGEQWVHLTVDTFIALLTGERRPW